MKTTFLLKVSTSNNSRSGTPPLNHAMIWSCSFLSIFSNEHQKVPPVNHRQKCLINGICGTFDMKSNYFGPVIPKSQESFEKLEKRVIKCKQCVSINRSKTASL